MAFCGIGGRETVFAADISKYIVFNVHKLQFNLQLVK